MVVAKHAKFNQLGFLMCTSNSIATLAHMSRAIAPKQGQQLLMAIGGYALSAGVRPGNTSGGRDGARTRDLHHVEVAQISNLGGSELHVRPTNGVPQLPYTHTAISWIRI